MSSLAPAWKRWALLATLFAIGVLWIAAFVLFRARGADFLAVEFNEAARDRARIPRQSLPVELAFGQGMAGTAMLGDGWWSPDDIGTWSWSERASVFLRRPREPGPFWLTFGGSVFVPGRHEQRVRLFVDGVPVGDWFAHRDATVLRESVRIDHDPARDGILQLTFEMERIASPFRTGRGPDSRNLGFLLQTIELTAEPPTAPKQ